MDNKKGIGVSVGNRPISVLLEEMASNIEGYFFLPYYFRIVGDHIIAYHLEDMPEELKKAINRNREST